MSYWERFSRRLKTLDDAREPFRGVLRQALAPEVPARLLIYTPSNEAIKHKSPASVLALTDRDWLLAGEVADGAVRVTRCDFACTLQIELTDTLLYGALRIAFVERGESRSVAIEFNTVMLRYYDEATQRVLDGMDRIEATPVVDPAAWNLLLESLPLKFQNALLRFTPRGQYLRKLVRWPAGFSARRRWFQRELCPEAVLALTDRELLLISEEPSWSWRRMGRPDKYGAVATHCPFSRLETYPRQSQGSVCTVEVSVSTAGGRSKLRIELPHDRQRDVERLLGEVPWRLARQSAADHAPPGSQNGPHMPRVPPAGKLCHPR